MWFSPSDIHSLVASSISRGGGGKLEFGGLGDLGSMVVRLRFTTGESPEGVSLLLFDGKVSRTLDLVGLSVRTEGLEPEVTIRWFPPIDVFLPLPRPRPLPQFKFLKPLHDLLFGKYTIERSLKGKIWRITFGKKEGKQARSQGGGQGGHLTPPK